jgi:DNA polymerase III alpha subunit (gram-positive type)
MSYNPDIPECELPNAFIDLETTGFKPGVHEIIEIGGVITNAQLEIIDEIDIKVQPVRIETASAHAMEVNGYTPESWLGAISLRSAMEIFSAKTENAIMSGHNTRFDLSFLLHAFEETGVENKMHNHKRDNIFIAKQRLKDSGLNDFTQKAVAIHLGVEPEPDIHRAINGAYQAYQIYKKLMEIN